MASVNGHAPKHISHAEVRESLKVRIAEAVAAGKPKTARRLLESFWLWDGFGGSDLLDRLRPRTNDSGDGDWMAPPSVPSDRRHGADWWVWRNQWELDQYRQQSRLRHAQNSYAQGLLKNLTNNVIGKGYAYEAKALGEDGKPVPKEEMDGKQKAECLDVQKVMNRFLQLNNWNGVAVNPLQADSVTATCERELFRTQKIDGEVFVRFSRLDNGDCITRVIDASQIRDGAGYLVQDGWTYGIQHQMEPYEDVRRRVQYAVFWPDLSAKGGLDGAADMGTWEEVDADEVVHLLGPDTPSTVKRGLGIFLFGLGDSLDRADKLQRNASIGAAVRSAFASTEQWRQATQGQIQNMADALAASKYTDGRTGQQVSVERIRPGTIRRVPEGWEQAPAAEDNTASFLTAVQGDLQEAGAGVCAPAYWFGDTGEVNYNNAESAAAPAVRDGQTEQEYWKAAFALCVWKAVLWAVECGKLSEGVEERIAIYVEAPAVLHRNELEKAQEDQILVTMGIKDRQTCAAERGLDYATVEANNQEYEDEHGLPGQPLGTEDDGEGGESGPQGPKPPKPKAPTLESKEPISVVVHNHIPAQVTAPTVESKGGHEEPVSVVVHNHQEPTTFHAPITVQAALPPQVTVPVTVETPAVNVHNDVKVPDQSPVVNLNNTVQAAPPPHVITPITVQPAAPAQVNAPITVQAPAAPQITVPVTVEAAQAPQVTVPVTVEAAQPIQESAEAKSAVTADLASGLHAVADAIREQKPPQVTVPVTVEPAAVTVPVTVEAPKGKRRIRIKKNEDGSYTGESGDK